MVESISIYLSLMFLTSIAIEKTYGKVDEKLLSTLDMILKNNSRKDLVTVNLM